MKEGKHIWRQDIIWRRWGFCRQWFCHNKSYKQGGELYLGEWEGYWAHREGYQVHQLANGRGTDYITPSWEGTKYICDRGGTSRTGCPEKKDHHLFANNSVENHRIIFPFSAKEFVECANDICYISDELGKK